MSLIHYESKQTPDGTRHKKVIVGDKAGTILKSIILAALILTFILALIYMGVPVEKLREILEHLPKF